MGGWERERERERERRKKEKKKRRRRKISQSSQDRVNTNVVCNEVVTRALKMIVSLKKKRNRKK